MSIQTTFIIVSTAINALLMLIPIFGNALVLAAILRTPSLRSPSTIFLCNLAVSDLLSGLIVQPVFIANSYSFEPESSLYLSIQVMTRTVCGVSLSTMTAISVDRLLALYVHMRYPNFMTIKCATYVSTALWFFGISLSCVRLYSVTASNLIAAVGISLCLLVSLFSYLRVYLIVRRHQLQIHVQQQAEGHLNVEDNQGMIRSKKSVIAAFIYFICMTVCYSPLMIFLAIIKVPPDRFGSLVWAMITTTVAYLNSTINPFLYCWRMGELRRAVVNILRKILCNQTQES